MSTQRAVQFAAIVAFIYGAASNTARADIELPDWTTVTFSGASSLSEHLYYPLDPGTFSVYEGEIENGVVERIETFVTFETKTILGVETRVIRDKTFKGGLLVEVALDWYAQSTEGTVWYFGEYVENFHYNQRGELVSTDNLGSWTADGVVFLPGAIMLADPEKGDEYYQEFAPGVAFDFAIVTGLSGVVRTPAGSFDKVLGTSEGNLFDGPNIAENKYYAPDVGLILIEVLDDNGRPEFAIPLISQTVVSCLGDIDHDRSVSASDLGALLGAWGEDDFFADLDGSGEVDAKDLAIVLANWGQCSP
ncbi:MAG: hypothetical protein SGJ09_06165 [Phycisphaerae bacterium]|nr:hypothetical protein [Phycisphaerae bacterium]